MATEKPGEKSGGFLRVLGLFDSTMIVAGSMIGSGIFIGPSLMAGYMPVPQVLLLLWVVGGILTAFGAVAYGELAAMMPRAGGQYVYLRQAFGKLTGFLYGWTLFFVVQTGFIAAVAIAFAKYLGVLLPYFSETNTLLSIPVGSQYFNINTAQLAGVAVIALLTALNCFGVALGAWVQNIFTVSKVAAIAGLVLAVFLFGDGNFSNYSKPFSMGSFQPLRADALTLGFFAALAVAMSKALFAYDAWNSVTFAAGEIKNPWKTLPRALVLGTVIVTAVYCLANLCYLYITPIDEMANVPENRIAAFVANRVFGNLGEILITVAILISAFGCDNGLILAGPRVYYAMARDGLFLNSAGTLNEKYRTPVVSLIYQGLWASVLTLSGTYNALLTYTTFASLLFNALTVGAVFYFRKKSPEMERPYRCWGYPVVPLIYLAVSIFFVIFIVAGDPISSGTGLLLVLLGLPMYFYWNRKNQQSITKVPV